MNLGQDTSRRGGKNPSEEKEAGTDEDSSEKKVTEVGKNSIEKDSHSNLKKRQKRSSILSDVIFYVALILMVLCAVIFSGGKSNSSIGGYSFWEVLTTSMQSVYPRGSLVVVKKVNPGDLVVGDDITFLVDPVTTYTHRIVKIQENYENTAKRGFTTKGVDNPKEDSNIVMADNVVGKVVFHIPFVGQITNWLFSNVWILLLFFFSLIGFSFFIKIYWRESRKEKSA